MSKKSYHYEVGNQTFTSRYAREIYEILKENAPLSQRELADELGISASNLSNILKRVSGLVITTKKGKQVLYSLNPNFLSGDLTNKKDSDELKTQEDNLDSYFTILICNVLMQSKKEDAIFIMENLEKMQKIFSINEIILILYSLDIIEITNEELEKRIQELENAGLYYPKYIKSVLKKYYDFLVSIKTKQVIKNIRKRIPNSSSNNF